MAIPDTEISVVRLSKTDRRHYCDNSWSLVHYCVTVRSANNRHLQTARTWHEICRRGRDANVISRAKFLKIHTKAIWPPKMALPIHEFIALTTAYARRASLWWRHSCTLSHYAIQRSLVVLHTNYEQFTITKYSIARCSLISGFSLFVAAWHLKLLKATVKH